MFLILAINISIGISIGLVIRINIGIGIWIGIIICISIDIIVVYYLSSTFEHFIVVIDIKRRDVFEMFTIIIVELDCE